ncbi:MAG: response regulator, partial [Deltaproteobacteria bacterium]|nr:response regulator [Deltaproteobacteria bacterium]
DLVITDQTMPEMTGLELARQLILIRPDIPIILSTGYSQTIEEDNVGVQGIGACVMKPVRVREIAVKIRKVLDHK